MERDWAARIEALETRAAVVEMASAYLIRVAFSGLSGGSARLKDAAQLLLDDHIVPSGQDPEMFAYVLKLFLEKLSIDPIAGFD